MTRQSSLPGGPGRASSLIVTSSGTPMPRARAENFGSAVRGGPSTAYAGADPFSAEGAAWHPGLRSADSEVLPERNILVARSRDMVRNNAWAAGIVQRFVDQIIGSNFRLRWTPDWRRLGFKDHRSAQIFIRDVERKFNADASDPRNPFDAAGKLSLSGIFGLKMRHSVVDGESLALSLYKERPGIRQGTCLQVVDPDRLSNPSGQPDNDTMRGGIERDVHGSPMAFHIREGHPADRYNTTGAAFRWSRVDTVTPWGRRQVLHNLETYRADQSRGVPLLAPVLDSLRMDRIYTRTEVQRAVAAAIFGPFIETPFDGNTLLNDSEEKRFESYLGMAGAYHDQPVTMGGVKVGRLFPGETIRLPQAGAPNAGYASFREAEARNVAAATGQSYGQVAQTWAGYNYSSMRGDLSETWKNFMARRGHFAHSTATPVFALWLEEALETGHIKPPPGAPNFWNAFEAWVSCDWIGPGRGWIDQVKEVDAAAKRKAYMLSTATEEAALQGYDFEQLVEEQASEKMLLAEYGLESAPSPNLTAGGKTIEDPDADPDAADRAERRQSQGA